jgi:AraC family transcriptional regulator, ethanolamine operon transcriptional activator
MCLVPASVPIHPGKAKRIDKIMAPAGPAAGKLCAKPLLSNLNCIKSYGGMLGTSPLDPLPRNVEASVNAGDTMTVTHPNLGAAGATTVHSIDAAVRMMQDWQLETLQMSPGKINYSLTMQRFGAVQILREKTDKTLLKRGSSPPGAVVFSIAVQADGTGWLSGHEMAPQVSLLVDGQRLPEVLTPRGFDLVYLSVNRQWLIEQVAARGYGQLASHLQQHHSIALWHDHGTRLDQLFTPLLMRDREQSGERAATERMVLDNMLRAFTSAQRLEPVTESSRKQLIDRARMMLMRNTSEQASVADVAAHLGISRRHLQTCFNLSVGIGATEFVKAERLNLVRQELFAARDAGRVTSIGDAAANWGFWHLSRFAAYYREMFGELPSETFRPVQD